MEPDAEPTTNADSDSALLLSIERRLRKMSQEFPPTAFVFRVHARVLCVGLAVVYRVAISITTTTTCIVAQPSHPSPMSSSASAPAQPGASCETWVIAMSQAKFRTFFTHVHAILQTPAVRACCLRNSADPPLTTTAWKPFERFMQTLAALLAQYEPLQHNGFAIHANVAAMHASKSALEAFLTGCWCALEPIIPSLAAEPHLPAAAPLGREVLCIYVLLRDLLALPERILEANCIYASAILSLADVEELLVSSNSDQTCSICLERLASADTRTLDPADADSGGSGDTDSSDGESAAVACGALTSGALTSAFSVTLPCAHLFHENCIMAWLRHNPSCPECRAGVGVR